MTPIPFTFALETVGVIVEGLSELPYKRVAGLIQAIGERVYQHQNPAPPEAPAPAPTVQTASRRRKKNAQAT